MKHVVSLRLSSESSRLLTARQRAFAIAYAEIRNGLQAVRKAGYKGTDGSLRVTASRLLTNANILRFIEALEAPAIEKAQVTLERIMVELASIAFFPWEKIKEQAKGGMSHATKLQALKLLGEHLGMFSTKEPMGNERPSLHLHYRPDMTSEEARISLLRYLRQRKLED